MSASPRLNVVFCFVFAAVLMPALALGQRDPYPPVPIAEIQGAGPVSPFVQEWVDVVGVVTGVTVDGFYLQDPIGDGNAQTSDGIFVYTRTVPPVHVGDCVRLRQAFVDEFYGKTELSRIKSIASSDGCPIKSVTPVAVSPAQLGTDPGARFEQVEGMLVSMDDLTGVVQGPTKRFKDGEAEIAFIPDQWVPYVSGTRVFQWQADAVLALMFVSSRLGAVLPELNWGDGIAIGAAPGVDDAVVGVLDYNFGKFQFLPLPDAEIWGRPAEIEAVQQPAEASVLQSQPDSDFTVCSFNLLGMGHGTDQYPDPDEYLAQLRKRARAIAESLEGCTIIGLQEVGTPQDAQALADLLADEFALTYTATAIDGPGTTSLEFPLTNGLLSRDDRVIVVAAELRQGCSRIDYDVRPMAGACPAGTFGLFNRPPLIVDLEVRGTWGAPFPLTVISNHWKSKGGDETVNVVRRIAQAGHVAALVQARLAADPAAAVVVLGDLNDYYRSGPVDALRTGVTPPLVHTFDTMRVLNRYSYIFNGGSQLLDHVLVTQVLLSAVAEVRPVRINADYAYPAKLDPTVYHSSDHDPILMRLRPDGAAWLSGDLRYPGITVDVETESGSWLATVTTDANGEFRIWNLTPSTVSVKLTSGDAVTIEEVEFAVDLAVGANNLPVPAITHASVEQGVRAAVATLACYVTPDCLD